MSSSRPIEFDNGFVSDGPSDVNGKLQVNGDLQVTGNLTYNGVADADILPSTNTTYSIGTAGSTWLNLHTRNFVSNSAGVYFRNVKPVLFGSNSSTASISIPSGTAPSAPLNGDLWVVGADVNFRQNNTTKTFAYLDSKVSSSNTADQLTTARTIAITGDATGSATFDGTSNASISITLTQTYLTQATGDLRYLRLAGGSVTGNINPNSNTLNFGQTNLRWNIFANTINTSGNSTVGGNLIVNGGLTVNNSPIDTTAGNITTTANGLTLVGGGANASFNISRGASPTVSILWNELTDKWTFTSDGTNFFNILFADGGTYNIGISGNANTSNTALLANNSTHLNGQLASFYTDIPSRLGYTPANRAGDTFTGAITFNNGITTTTATITSSASFGDSNNSLSLVNSNPRWTLDTNDFLTFTRSTNRLALNINNSELFVVNTTSSYFNGSSIITQNTLGPSLPVANTLQQGIVQLVDSVSSTSITTAATPNSVKTAYDAAINANTNASNASFLSSGTVSTARLATSGTPDASTFLRGDGTWAAGVSGVQGLQGIQGVQGLQGRQGTQGTQGSQGAQGVQGLQGRQGTQGLQGTLGTQGLQGTLGTQGTQGIQGTLGTQGTQGLQGIQGSRGIQGFQGTQGVQGIQGTSVQGIQGTQGISGASILNTINTWTAKQTFNGGSVLKAYNESATTATIVSGSYNVDLSASNIFNLTLSGSPTFTFSNPPTSGTMISFTLILRQDGSGNRTIGLPGTCRFTDGVAPVLATGANKIDVIQFFTVDGGSTYCGVHALANV